jgi:glycosyltransferase involved in cell wall biosynthesis
VFGQQFYFFAVVKVLILHQHFKTPATGGAIRSYYLAKALIDHGHEVVVVTADPEGHERTETYEGIEVHYVAVAYDNSYGFYARGWAFLKFVFLAGGEARRIRGIDLCYAISVPITVSIAARWMRFWRRVPYVLEVGDLWPDAPIEMGFVRSQLLKSYLFRVERMAYKKARSIVALSPDIQKVVQSRAPGKHVAMIPNMADCEFFQPEEKDPSLARKFGVEGKFVVSYLGAMGFANGLDYILDCAREAGKSQLPIHFLLAGDGAHRETLVRVAAEHGLGNVTILPFTNRDGVKEIMNVTDAVFVCYRDISILSTGSPNKFFDGLAAGKVIVLNFGGWIKNEIEASGCGFSADPQQPADFLRKVEPIIKNRNRYSEAARKLGMSKFERKELTEQWIAGVTAPRASDSLS